MAKANNTEMNAEGEEAEVKQGVAPATREQQADAGMYSVTTTASVDGRVMIGQDVEIFPAKPLPALNNFGSYACEAKDRRLLTEQFALICTHGNIPRVTSVASYRNIKTPFLLRLVDTGIVTLPAENRQVFALVFEKPSGRKLMETPDAEPFHIHEDRIVSTLVQPILMVLSEFRNVDFIHGAVNLENIYISGAEGAETIMLGECLSSAPSMGQRAIYETIERSMAQPTARGLGTIKEDLYALGMCVVMATRGKNLMTGKSDRQIIMEKIEHGSYGAVIGRERMPPGIAEFLRGVLNDDETQRWDIDDALRWLDGRRLSPKQPRMSLKAARPFLFKQEKYWDMRSIAFDFNEDIASAMLSMEKDNFGLWVKRNFEDKDLDQRLDETWEREKSSSRERLVAGVCMVLDPHAPVRYKRLSFFPAGFGTALASAMAKGEDIQTFAEAIQMQLVSAWVNLRFEEIPDAAGIMGNYEKARSYLTQKMPGYGIERVMYSLNREAVCMSPWLKDFFVLGPGSLLLALEKLSKRPDRPEQMLDRHMIAFISVREPKMIDPYIGHITSTDKGYRMIGLLRCFSTIQRRFTLPALPGMSSWIVSMLGPSIERFNDRDLRQEIAKRVTKLADSGDLTELLEVVDDNRLSQDDTQRYTLARREYSQLTQEKSLIELHLGKRKNLGYATGRQISMLVSAILSALGIFGYILMYYTGGFH